MKKTLLFVALVIGSLAQLNAQCTITPGCSPAATGYCTTPAENTNLPNATVASSYNTVIQVSIASSLGATTITSAQIVSMTGLPTGLSYSVNPGSGIIAGGANGCVLLTGTPTSTTAGNYTVVANVVITTNVGAFPPATVSWFLTVNPALSTGIQSINTAANFYIAPNPVSSELFISSDSHFGKIQVIDALGKIVLSLDTNYASQTSINVSSLTKGVYFIQANDGERIITKKFIKD
jgi:hypothetical protein